MYNYFRKTSQCYCSRESACFQMTVVAFKVETIWVLQGGLIHLISTMRGITGSNIEKTCCAFSHICPFYYGHRTVLILSVWKRKVGSNPLNTVFLDSQSEVGLASFPGPTFTITSKGNGLRPQNTFLSCQAIE